MRADFDGSGDLVWVYENRRKMKDCWRERDRRGGRFGEKWRGGNGEREERRVRKNRNKKDE